MRRCWRHSIPALFGRWRAVWRVTLSEYKRHLAACDAPAVTILTGAVNLSEEALSAFTEFFSEPASTRLIHGEPDAAGSPAYTHTALGRGGNQAQLLAPKSGSMLEAVLYRGELPRADGPLALAWGIAMLAVSCRHLWIVVCSLRRVHERPCASFFPRRSRHDGCRDYSPNVQSLLGGSLWLWLSGSRSLPIRRIRPQGDANTSLSRQLFGIYLSTFI